VRRQRGTAVVMAMLVVALAVLLVSGAFERQSAMARQVENEVAYAQARLLLQGAIDWARVILREDARTSAVDHAGEPWAVSLEQTRLDNEGDDPAWVAGAMRDAQGRFNLRNLSGPNGPIASEIAVLSRLLDMVGANPTLAEPLAMHIVKAVTPQPSAPGAVPVLPATLDDVPLPEPALREAMSRLQPFVTLLPDPTPVNANTAPAEVLAARFDNLSLSDARRLVASRDRAWFRDVNDVLTRLDGLRPSGSLGQLAVDTQYFAMDGVVEFRRARVHARVLLKREGGRVEVVWMQDGAA
jgi:general secretion pathway protein K